MYLTSLERSFEIIKQLILEIRRIKSQLGLTKLEEITLEVKSIESLFIYTTWIDQIKVLSKVDKVNIMHQ